MTTDALREELFNTGLFRIIERKEMKRILEEKEFQSSYCAETECAVRAGRLLNANKILVGNVKRSGNGYILDTRIINVEKSKIEFGGKTSKYSEKELDDVVGKLSRELAQKMSGEKVIKTQPEANIQYPEPSTNIISTNKVIYINNDTTSRRTSRWNNFSLFWLQIDEKFKDKFSAGAKGKDEYYYRMPFNSWNDNFYLTFSFDWKLNFLRFLKPRAGWCLEMNFSGSGNGGDTQKVELDTDLGKKKDEEFYAIYNFYKFPVMAIFRIQPISIWIFNFYAGAGAGGYLGIATYNELIGKEVSSIERSYEKTFIPVGWVVKFFSGISFDTIKEFQTVFLEINYKFAREPVMTNDFFKTYDEDGNPTGGYERHIKFQVSGLSFGFGFRFE